MEKNPAASKSSKVSIEKITESIRKNRDQWINELLKESSLMLFLEEHYNTVAISRVKLEFLMRDLKELQNSSIDLVHYSALITQMKEANISIPVANHPLFLNELKSIVKKYGF
jgi:hypothetical protein